MGVISIGYGGDWFYLLEGMTKYIVSGPMTSFSSQRDPEILPSPPIRDPLRGSYLARYQLKCVPNSGGAHQVR